MREGLTQSHMYSSPSLKRRKKLPTGRNATQFQRSAMYSQSVLLHTQLRPSMFTADTMGMCSTCAGQQHQRPNLRATKRCSCTGRLRDALGVSMVAPHGTACSLAYFLLAPQDIKYETSYILITRP